MFRKSTIQFMFYFSFLDLSGTTKKEKRGKKQTFELPHNHTFFQLASFLNLLTPCAGPTQSTHVLVPSLPPSLPFFTKCFCQHGAGSSRTKRPLPSSSEGVRRDEELVLALNAKSITPSMSAASSSSVSSATPNFRKPQYKYHLNVFPKFEQAFHHFLFVSARGLQ